MGKKNLLGGVGYNGIEGGDFAIVMLGFCLCDWSFGLYVCWLWSVSCNEGAVGLGISNADVWNAFSDILNFWIHYTLSNNCR
jgi:hypothetical protein